MLNLQYQLLRIRRIEEAIANDYPNLLMRCPTHLSIGQEAIAVGVCANLEREDKVFSGHRAHAHYLAKGGNLNALIAELHGKTSGCSKGRGGSMHLIDLSVGFMGSTAIVGGTIPLAVGCAWANKLNGNDEVTVVFFGDGCFEEGVMHESLNFAALHQLPILFVCENNELAVTTPIEKRRLGDSDIVSLAWCHGIRGSKHDGQDLQSVYSYTKEAIDRIRFGEGPRFLEFTTERERVHCGIEHEYKLIKDPINKVLPAMLEWEKTIQSEIEEAFKFAKNSPIILNPEKFLYADS